MGLLVVGLGYRKVGECGPVVQIPIYGSSLLRLVLKFKPRPGHSATI